MIPFDCCGTIILTDFLNVMSRRLILTHSGCCFLSTGRHIFMSFLTCALRYKSEAGVEYLQAPPNSEPVIDLAPNSLGAGFSHLNSGLTHHGLACT